MVKMIVKNLTKLYKENTKISKYALRKVSFNVNFNGGIFTIIGRNGAGKTTLIRMLSTELLPSSGSINIDGIDVIKNPEKLREKIAVIPQEGRLVPWMTPKQNIVSYLLWRGFSYKEATTKAIDVLRTFRLEEYMNKLPERLSGGMKRKALVAMAVSSDAKIIFLDEPTTGLDPVSRREFWSVLKKLKVDHFIILTTHYLEEAEELSDKIAVLNNGKLLAFGMIDNLRKSIGYPYAIRVFSKNYKLGKISGKLIRKEDGTKQIFSSEKEANKLASEFIQDKVKFSINPTSLEDIFYMIVGNINEEKENETE
jgi:ABC-2 type transport system ATP-binding protein